MSGGQFWSSPNLEPKRNFRFKMNVGDVCFYLVKSAGRPNFEISQTEHSYLNHTFKFPGRVTWQDIDVTLVDPIDDNSLEKMRDIIVRSGYNWINEDALLNETDLNTISKAKAVAAVSNIGNGKGISLQQIDANGKVVDEWIFRNAWISKVTPNELSYENEDLSDITLTITYDFAILKAQR